jgi:hypothetical protein
LGSLCGPSAGEASPEKSSNGLLRVQIAKIMGHPIPGKGVRHLPAFAAAGLVLAMIAVAGLLYSSTGSAPFGPESAIVLDGALAIGTLVICAAVAVLLIKFP